MNKQVAYIAATMGYTFIMTVAIAKAFDFVPFLRLRADNSSEKIGMDDAEVGALSFKPSSPCRYPVLRFSRGYYLWELTYLTRKFPPLASSANSCRTLSKPDVISTRGLH